MSSLEKALHKYTLSSCQETFDIKTVPVAPVEIKKSSTSAVDQALPGAKKADAKPTSTR